MKTEFVNGARLSTVDRGRGTPLVLAHGFPLDHTMWSAQIETLSDCCRVIAPDLRGFGQSEVTEGKVTMEQLADDVAGLLDALEVREPVVFCGLSMGGYVAWPFWQRHGRRVRGLVLCDTRSQADSREAAAARLAAAERVLAEGPGFLVEAMTSKLFAPDTFASRPESVESMRRVMLAANRQGMAAAARGMAERPDATPMLPTIDCPALVVVGRHDVISPSEEMRAMADAIPGARFVEIPNAGHMSPVETPDEVSAAIRAFVKELEG